MGPRFPAGISQAKEIANAFSRCSNHGADGDRDRASARRHHQATEAAPAALLRREFQSPESDLSRGGKIVCLSASAPFCSRPPEREWDCLLRKPKIDRCARGKTNERR